MSQYAYAKSLMARGFRVKLDVSSFDYYRQHKFELDKFRINIELANLTELSRHRSSYFPAILMNVPFLSSGFRRLLVKFGLQEYDKNILTESSHMFDLEFLEPRDDVYIMGDFKSEKYFRNVRTSLLNDFTIKSDLSSYALKTALEIKDTPVSCFIHVRRGDFANDRNTNKVHGTCAPSYYIKASSIMRKNSPGLKFFLFSNDLEWCRKNIKGSDIVYVDNSTRNSPHEDIYLMSMCNHSIIDHSAFCWWGAWLNQSDTQLVVAPNSWFASEHLNLQSDDIYCAGWIKV